jgi:hypothetical protein
VGGRGLRPRRGAGALSRSPHTAGRADDRRPADLATDRRAGGPDRAGRRPARPVVAHRQRPRPHRRDPRRHDQEPGGRLPRRPGQRASFLDLFDRLRAERVIPEVRS